MATRLYSIEPGANLESMTEAAGSAITTKHIELTVDCASTVVNDGTTTRKISKNEVLIALDLFAQYITRGSWPPV